MASAKNFFVLPALLFGTPALFLLSDTSMMMMIGKVINKYRIEAKLGEGGMGVVYKAWDTVLERPVALKMLHPAFAQDEKFLQRFRAEAKALAQLENPHIVAVYDLPETESGLFIVMQFVDGITLAEKIQQQGALPYEEATTIIKQLLDSLIHAHGVGIIHRDIKPGNVMITPAGVVKATDFGLAKVQHGSVLTLSKITGGTLRYMPPEQLRNLANVDRRSDLYSAGMTFYEMLAGRLPFDKHEDIYALSKTIVEGKFSPPNRFREEVPAGLARIVMKAIHKDPKKRYQNAEEMLAAITGFEQPQVATTEKKSRRRLRMIVEIVWSLVIVMTALVFLLTDLDSRLLDGLGLADYVQLSIFTEPDNAGVRLNGEFIGYTPIQRRRVRVRPQATYLYVEKINYRSIDTSFVLAPDRDSTLRFILRPFLKSRQAVKAESLSSKPDMGAVQITALPEGALIYLKGKRVGKTRYEDEAMPVGEHRFRVSHKGYKDSVVTIVVRREAITRVNVSLKRLMGVLKVLINPYGSIYIDDTLHVENMELEYSAALPVGIHKVRAVHPMLGTREREIEVKPNQPNELIIDFEK